MHEKRHFNTRKYNHLSADECDETIEAYTYADWKPLLDLIPKIEQQDDFTVDTRIDEMLEQGEIYLGEQSKHALVQEFLDVVYGIPLIISFSWASWDEGRNIMQAEAYDFDSLSLTEKCKLITGIVRSERFSSGVLTAEFNNGKILKILKSIERQVS
jgi:hypothetical protein